MYLFGIYFHTDNMVFRICWACWVRIFWWMAYVVHDNIYVWIKSSTWLMRNIINSIIISSTWLMRKYKQEYLLQYIFFWCGHLKPEGYMKASRHHSPYKGPLRNYNWVGGGVLVMYCPDLGTCPAPWTPCPTSSPHPSPTLKKYKCKESII